CGDRRTGGGEKVRVDAAETGELVLGLARLVGATGCQRPKFGYVLARRDSRLSATPLAHQAAGPVVHALLRFDRSVFSAPAGAATPQLSFCRCRLLLVRLGRWRQLHSTHSTDSTSSEKREPCVLY